jgi:hypothetical protein
MSETLISTRKCNLSAIKIPSVVAALSVMSSEILVTSLHLAKIQEASTSLEEIIRNSHFVDVSAHYEAATLKQLVHNLNSDLELAISEVQERIASLKVILSRKAIIPATLSTADDISVAFHIALNGLEIDWPLAEMVLERFSSLSTWSSFGRNVWTGNNFDSNMIKLIKKGDCWRLRKSLKFIKDIVYYDFSIGSVEFYDSLASLLMKPTISFQEDEEMEWASFIVRKQDKAIDLGISRLINSFLYSRKGKTEIAWNVLNIILTLKDEEDFSSRMNSISKSPFIARALVQTLNQEKDDTHVVNVCLEIARIMITAESGHFLCHTIGYEICPALIMIIDMYLNDEEKMNNVLLLIYDIIFYRETIPLFKTTDLFRALVQIFESPCHHDILTDVVMRISAHNDDLNLQFFESQGRIPHDDFLHQFHKLGIPEESTFFGDT